MTLKIKGLQVRERISVSAHMGQQSQLGRTQAACERHAEEEKVLAGLEGEAPTAFEAFSIRRHHHFSLGHVFCPPAPQHDWLRNIETPSYMEMTDDAEDQRLAG